MPDSAVVLVEPQGPLNIGSVCRVMMNFGFTDLRLVNPEADHLSKPARDMAVKAGHLLDDAPVFSGLADAIADCQLVIGTTCRQGKYRELNHPADLRQLLGNYPASINTAFVFGREDSGLTLEELDLCHHFLTIPTNSSLTSMNLAQAVNICLYELAGIGDMPSCDEGEFPLADNRKLEEMYKHIRQSLFASGYLDPQNPDHILRSFRRIFGRAGLDEREVSMIRGLMRRIEWLNNNQKTD